MKNIQTKSIKNLEDLNILSQEVLQWINNQKKPAVICLYGDLGAGKTTFTRYFLKNMGFNGRVKSPTFPILETYAVNGVDVFHFDFYRIKDENELDCIGVSEYLNAKKAIILIEWPDKAENKIENRLLNIFFDVTDNFERICRLEYLA